MKPWWQDSLTTLYHGDARSIPIESGIVQTCVTSPPYWGLRDYKLAPSVWGGLPECPHEFGAAGSKHRGGPQGSTGERVTRDTSPQDEVGDIPTGSICEKCGAWLGCLGLEPRPEMYVANIVTVFREVWRVLKNDGTLWLNLGDSYTSGGRNGRDPGASKIHPAYEGDAFADGLRPPTPVGLKPKDIVGIPWMVAFALRADGWYLRQDIIWAKPNPMPESVTDRCTKAHEYLFLLSKSANYYCDMEAIKEPSVTNDPRRPYTSDGTWEMNGRPTEQRHGGEPRCFNGSKFNTGKTSTHQLGRSSSKPRTAGNKNHKYVTANENSETTEHQTKAGLLKIADVPWESRNARSVWTISTKPYPGAHFATFPPALAERCILAGSRRADLVLDPFSGSGTAGAVARQHGRVYVGIDLNEEYLQLAHDRFAGPLFRLDMPNISATLEGA